MNIDDYFLQGNHGRGSHPHEDIKVFEKQRVSDHLYTTLFSMIPAMYKLKGE